MKTYEHRERQVTERVLTRHVCDLCGKDLNATGSYNIADVTVECETGSSYPDSGSCLKLSADICPECFKSKLVPWLESQGAKIERSEREW